MKTVLPPVSESQLSGVSSTAEATARVVASAILNMVYFCFGWWWSVGKFATYQKLLKKILEKCGALVPRVP